MRTRTLPEKLQWLRGRAGLSQTQAAKRIGVGRDGLSLIERGKRRPSIPTLAKIAAAYEVDLEYLLGQQDELDPADLVPTLTREQFLERGIVTTTAEMAALRALMELLVESAQKDKPFKAIRTIVVPDESVDMERVHLLFDYAIMSGILGTEDVMVMTDGVRKQAAASAKLPA
jgi:putative transcriptional regulator